MKSYLWVAVWMFCFKAFAYNRASDDQAYVRYTCPPAQQVLPLTTSSALSHAFSSMIYRASSFIQENPHLFHKDIPNIPEKGLFLAVYAPTHEALNCWYAFKPGDNLLETVRLYVTNKQNCVPDSSSSMWHIYKNTFECKSDLVDECPFLCR